MDFGNSRPKTEGERGVGTQVLRTGRKPRDVCEVRLRSGTTRVAVCFVTSKTLGVGFSTREYARRLEICVHWCVLPTLQERL